jgi:hypothetical protein
MKRREKSSLGSTLLGNANLAANIALPMSGFERLP